MLRVAVARKKSLFDDRPEEIQRLTLVIKQDINVLNRSIGQLQQVLLYLQFDYNIIIKIFFLSSNVVIQS